MGVLATVVLFLIFTAVFIFTWSRRTFVERFRYEKGFRTMPWAWNWWFRLILMTHHDDWTVTRDFIFMSSFITPCFTATATGFIKQFWLRYELDKSVDKLRCGTACFTVSPILLRNPGLYSLVAIDWLATCPCIEVKRCLALFFVYDSETVNILVSAFSTWKGIPYRISPKRLSTESIDKVKEPHCEWVGCFITYVMAKLVS